MVLTKTWTKRFGSALAIILLIAFSSVMPANAVCDPALQSCSATWGVGETFFGNGGELNACGTAFCAKQSAGELAAGLTGRTYSDTVLADSPVAYWHLGETSGTTATDSSGRGHTGTYTGGYTQGKSSLTGYQNTSTYVDGVAGSYVQTAGNSTDYNIKDTSLNALKQLTVEFWYSGTQVGTGGAQPTGLVSANTDASNKQFIVGLHSTGVVDAQNIKSLGTYDDHFGSTVINDGKPHHIVVEYDMIALTVVVYVDGTLDLSTTTASYDTFGTPVLRIGDNLRGTPAAGTFDEVAIYRTNLTATQVAKHYGVGTGTAGYQARTGFNSNREEYLEFSVGTSSLDLGTASTATTKTGTATFNVKSYLATGYQVVTASAGPKNSTYTLASPSTPTANAVGTEQFGINLVSNPSCGGTMPGSLGTDPVPIPDGTFSYGYANSGYSTPCKFKYVNGDVIAKSNFSSGETDYTISYLMNIGNATPGGVYSMNHVLVATSTF